MSKKNKSLLIILLVLCIGLVGLTIAYFSNSTALDNIFSTKEYGTTYTEEFVSPDNWLPGDTTPKTITATNSGQVDQAVRISFTESWKAKDNTTLSGLIDENGNLTNNTENSEHAAIINFSDNDDWTYSNGYYYYNFRLAPNETTSSLIDSVTFNSKVKNSSNCVTNESNGTKTITCNSTQSGYDDATYTLTFNIETVQYDKYKEAWNTDIAILNESTIFCDAFEVGEIVEYNNAEYYVLKDSSTNDDYVTLLKKDPLTAEEVNQYSSSYVSQDGEYPYYESDTCNDNKQTGCSTNYNTSDVKKIIDGWSSKYSDDLVNISGYKARLLNRNEVSQNFLYDLSSGYYNSTSSTPKWFYKNYTYWTMNIRGDFEAISIQSGSNTGNYYLVSSKFHIRPVINLSKNKIEYGCEGEDIDYDYYIGEEINYNNNSYCVIHKSKISDNYVTLIKSEPLTYNELVTYNSGYEIGRANDSYDTGTISFYKGEDCYYNSDNDKDTTGCSGNYDTSNIKNVIDNWSDSFNSDLKEISGYKARLITYDELMDIGYYTILKDTSYVLVDDSDTKCSGKTWYNFGTVPTDKSVLSYNLYVVRPVINLKKCALNGTC